MFRLAWHLLKRILRVDLPVSFLAAFLVSSRDLISTGFAPNEIFQFISNLLLISCTLGFALSVWAYLLLYRDELYLFPLAGFRLSKISLISFAYMAFGSILTATIAFVIVDRL